MRCSRCPGLTERSGTAVRVLVTGVALAALGTVAMPAGAGETAELGGITVIGITPGTGAMLPVNLLPYSVQGVSGEEFDRAQALDASDYLNRHLAGVSLNSAQSNPLQPDLQFRGFTGTPLLGGSEGISVYVDGVRVNELFGDSVNWDLIPEEAMSSLTLLSGSNPIFGLNTLGGAIQIRTKNGFDAPGTSAQAYAGSFRRREYTLQSGGNNGGWGYFLLANHFQEKGWRYASDSRATSLMGTLSRRTDHLTLDLHLAHARTNLVGNGSQAVQLLQDAPDSVFTAPDQTRNDFDGAWGEASWQLAPHSKIAGTVFFRSVRTRSYNGDGTSFEACDEDPGILCDGDAPVLDQNGQPVGSAYDAVNNQSRRRQRSVGGTWQWILSAPLGARANQFVAGLDYLHGRVDFDSGVEASFLVPYAPDPLHTYVTQPDTGVLIPAATLAVHVNDQSVGAYLTDTLSITERFALTASIRYNHTRTELADLTGLNPDLDGRHSFHRANPALGFTLQMNPAVNLYAGYSESTRAPTPVELTCASPDAPCRLPNQFLADPELKQVVAKSVEAGLRGSVHLDARDHLDWHLGLFHTVNVDDLLFQSTGGAQSNQGYYANVGRTRRQGIEASLRGAMLAGRLQWHLNYTHLDATFRTPFLENSVNHPDADPQTGLIAVARGNRIPSLPRHSFKAGFDVRLPAAVTVGADASYQGSQYLRGDEANRLSPIGGFAVFNIRAAWRPIPHLSLFARADNIFDRRYANFGVLGNGAELFGQLTDPRFLGPGAPRAGWAGFEWEL